MSSKLFGIKSVLKIRPYDIEKYLHFVFDTSGYQFDTHSSYMDIELTEVSAYLRGAAREPSVTIHGIMPRAGTVFIGQLLRLHPDFYGFPHEWYEFPFLQLSGEIKKLQRNFVRNHRHNAGKLTDTLFLTLFGSALMAHLHTDTPPGKRALIKVPNVEYLQYFWQMFPHEHLLVLIRDGRDIVDSTLKTWPQLQFSLVAHRWRLAAELVLACHQQFKKRKTGYCLIRYEDVLSDPEAFVRQACHRFDLDENKYPFDQLHSETSKIRGSSNMKENGEVIWEVQEKPDDFQPTGYWKSWPWHKKWLFKKIAGDMLIKLGYCENLDW